MKTWHFQIYLCHMACNKKNYNTNKINPIQIQNNKNGTCTNVQRN